MEKTIKNRDLYRFREGIEGLAGISASVQFSYWLIKNMRIIEAEISIFDKLLDPSKEYQEIYQPKIEAIAKKFCIKDTNGNPVPRVGPTGMSMYDFTADNKLAFDKAVEKLEKAKENELFIKERQEQLSKYNNLMELDIATPLNKILVEYLPEKITPKQLNMIFELVTER